MYKNINIGQFFHYTVMKKIKNNEDEWYIKLSINKHLKKFMDLKLKDRENTNNTNDILSWDENKDILFEYSNINYNVPNKETIYKNVNVYSFLLDQKIIIKNKIRNCKKYTEIEIYIKLSENIYVKHYLDEYFTTDHTKLTHKEKRDQLFDYCNTFNEIPKGDNSLRRFLDGQQRKINGTEDDLYKELSVNTYVKEQIIKFILSLYYKFIYHNLYIIFILINFIFFNFIPIVIGR